ncbi:MAG: hypothetical protein HY347_05220 [candidate division NC10 bacterium]|nr:hypothetical protein [candidate division NC10 bacterium]
MIRWFAGENGYSDAEIRSIIRRIEAMRTREEAAKPVKAPRIEALRTREEAAKPAQKPVRARRRLKKAA